MEHQVIKDKFKRAKERVVQNAKDYPEMYIYGIGLGVGTVFGFVLRDGLSFPIRGDGFYASAETWQHVRDYDAIPHTILTEKWGDFFMCGIKDQAHYDRLCEAYKEIQKDVLINS
jgi:hypothetical protein